MRPLLLALLLALFYFSLPCALADDPASPAPGNIKLLTGYVHEKLQGVDTLVGKISKPDGLTIQYDIGYFAGNHAAAQEKEKEKILWSKDQLIAGHPVKIVLTKDRTLYITFPDSTANFFAKIRSDEDLADMMLMILTYEPPTPPK